MLKRDRLCLAFALATTFVTGSIAVGCGSDGDVTSTSAGSSSSSGETGSSSSSSSSSGDVDAGPVACPTNEGIVLTVKELYFGEGNSGEWKTFGYNLDGKDSTGNSKDLCKVPAMGAASDTYPDGDMGIDNSFGKNLLPEILKLYPTWVTDINNGIKNGRFTAIVKLLCVPDTGDVPQFTTKLLSGTTLGMAPKFDGTDVWPIEPGLLNDPMDPESSSITFDYSSITGKTYDAGKGVVFIISVPVRTMTSSTSIKLTLYSARIKMDMNADRKTGATSGMIGGVLNTEEFVAEIKKVGDLVGLCGNPFFDGIITKIRQSSDIMMDGTQDVTKECDAISMGLGFDMSGGQIGAVGPANIVGGSCP